MSDLGRSFTFPFRHPSWLSRALVGAGLEALPLFLLVPLFVRVLRHGRPFLGPVAALLLPAVVVGLAGRFLVFGYLARAAREVIDGSSSGLPAWDRLGEDLAEGFKLWVAAVALWLPAVAVTAGLALLVMALSRPSFAWLPVILVGPPAALVTFAYLPAGLLAAVSRGELAAAFEFDRVAETIGREPGPYALAFLLGFGAEILAQLGLVLCCVGIVFTRFLAHCVTVHAFASAYREAVPAAAAGPTPAPSPAV